VEKWPTGIFAFWYPIKDRRETDGFAAALRKSIGREALRLELLVDDPADRTRLNGSGLLVVNPPWTLAADAEAMLPAIAERLARGDYGAYLCETWAPRT
jgi:23S rRNA (adenine2030-N6)-methyltransferase